MVIFPFHLRLWVYSSCKYLLEKNILRNLSLIHFSSLYREIFLLYLTNFLCFWVFDHFSTFLEKAEAFFNIRFSFFSKLLSQKNQFLSSPNFPQTPIHSIPFFPKLLPKRTNSFRSALFPHPTIPHKFKILMSSLLLYVIIYLIIDKIKGNNL